MLQMMPSNWMTSFLWFTIFFLYLMLLNIMYFHSPLKFHQHKNLL